MNGLNFFPVIHVRQKRLQSLVGNVSDWARLEALVLQYRYLGKVMSDIHADTFHFLDGSIAIFCIGKTDNDREQREVIAFRLTFQYIPTDFADEEDALANGILLLAVLLIKRILLELLRQLWCNQSACHNCIIYCVNNLVKMDSRAAAHARLQWLHVPKCKPIHCEGHNSPSDSLLPTAP